MKVVFFIIALLIAHTLVLYPLSLLVIDKIRRKKSGVVNNEYVEGFEPTVTVIIPAHNEEDVIEAKLKNLSKLDYPHDKLEIIIASDNSTDSTNAIVEKFINNISSQAEQAVQKDFKLYVTKERKGKTNAQNETVKVAKGEIIVFSDANAMLDVQAVREVVKYFSRDDVAYVAGRLIYTNSGEADSSGAEDTYWNYDLRMRQVESDVASITAGNGAIYAVRKDLYHDFDPVYCHDSIMPPYYYKRGYKALYNKDVKAYEKAGETEGDEFGRKVRMNRAILTFLKMGLSLFNVFKYKSYSYFYISHRFLRNSLFVLHLLLLVANIIIATYDFGFRIVLVIHIAFYLVALLGKWVKAKPVYMCHYYVMTIYAQLVGAIRQATGKSKPFWDKAESTR